MDLFPRRSSLYRNAYRTATFAVILSTSVWLAAQATTPQYGRKAAVDKGPRATGLVQLSPTGKKGRIIPIAIMIDGKFYDAGSYKASPVPMALDFGIVYEAFRAGVSQGVFTITQPGQLNHVWIAEGTWLPAGAIDPTKPKKFTTPVISDDDNDSRPVLHRRVPKTDSDNADNKETADQKKDDKSGDNKTSDNKATDNKDKRENKDEQKPATTASTTTAVPAASAPPSGTDASKPAPAATEPPKAPAPTPTSSSSSDSTDETISDPNRPRLRRGKPDPTAHHEPFTTFDAMDALPGAAPLTPASAKSTAAKDPAAMPNIVLIPAVSDAAGPDPRPYTYELKPEEEAKYRSKMLELAEAQLQPKSGAAKGASTKGETTSSPKSPKSNTKTKLKTAPVPPFDEITLRVFDLSSSNEPVLVLSAKTRPAALAPDATGSVEVPKEFTLIARSNLENELQKLFFSQTDSHHLDVTPRMELIDAVDADGDGRGELLFRRTFDDGSAYAIYRVSRDGLWPLFEGTP
jgi:hypothetical protein